MNERLSNGQKDQIVKKVIDTNPSKITRDDANKLLKDIGKLGPKPTSVSDMERAVRQTHRIPSTPQKK